MADPDPRIARIDTITEAARATWFTYIAVLAFTAVTLFGVEDVDFFALDRATDLPLVGISVPVTYFFAAGSVIVTAVYVWLHVLLEALWTAIGAAPARVNGDPLAAHVRPWLVTEMALTIRRHLRRRTSETAAHTRSAQPTPLSLLGVLATALLLFAAAPLLLLGFWLRSMPAHDA